MNVERPRSNGSLDGLTSNDETLHSAACRAQSDDSQIYIGVDRLNGQPVKVL